MSDPSEPKPPSIPTWQRQQQPPSPSADDEAQPQTPDTPTESPSESSSRSNLLQKASKFLEDDEIRAASTERKASFLESKGLTSDEVQRLLDAPPAKSDTEPVAKQEQSEQQDSHQAPSTSPQPRETKDMSTESPNKDIPPIITYPEHLFRPPASPPIVTLSRLLNTAYVLSSAVAVTYGTGKYIIQPMLSSLIAARHELFESASANTNTLNAKLEEAVSTIPDDAKNGNRNTNGKEDEKNEEEPNADETQATKFFHREIGTQTSPHLSRANSISSIASSQSQPQPQPSTTDIQISRLVDLQDQLKPFIPPAPQQAEESEVTTSSSLKQELSTLQAYLNGLLHGHTTTAPSKQESEDPISSVRTELRLAKGALLSSRNFPAGGRGVRSGAG